MSEVKTKTITGGTLVVETLKSLGVEVVFGVPGGQTLAITDNILTDESIRFVTARHESAAATMADAVGRLTGRPGVCMATTGPGATNMITGVGGAFRDSSPMIAIACNNRLATLDLDEAQAADHVSIFRPLVKWTKLVLRPERIQQALEEAFLRATGGCPGPVLVDFPRDVLEDEVDPELLAAISGSREAFANDVERPAPDPSRLEAAAEILAAAEAPSLWVGNGVKASDSGAAAIRLAESLSMPVMTTFNGIGAVRTDHPLVFGPLSRMGTELSTRVLSDTDVLVVVGNSLNAVSTGRWSFDLPQTIIQIDIDPSVIGRYYSARTLGICADAGSTLDLLTATLEPRRAEGPAAARASRLERLEASKRDWWEAVESGIEAKPGTVAPDAVLRTVRGVVPDDTIAVVDAGNPGVWSYLWDVRAPRSYLKPVGYGNMGFAVPAVIGARLARPGTPIVAFVGDGSLGMSLGELETLAREEIDACIVVLNDSGYGNIRQEQIAFFEGRTIGVDFTDVDYAAIARACGLKATRVDCEAALAEAVATAMREGGPYLVDVTVDPTVSAWTFPLFQKYDPEA